MLNPTLSRLRAAAGLDRRFVRGDGVWLFDEAGRRFLDGWSQYGAVALGHHHPRVVAAARAALDESAPAMLQPWPARHAEELARRLCALTGLDACLFTTSGAEAVEAALKLVRAATGRDLVVAAEGSFHGKTLGALSLTGRAHYKEGFGPLPTGVVHVPWGDAHALAKIFAQHGRRIAALFLEPIQGERGVHVAPPGWLELGRELCTLSGAALVLDEIQTGLGRAGALFCEVKADVRLIAKALGGGLFPLGALLARSDFWSEHFALSHSSTFANNDAACRVGLAVLDVLEGGLCDEVARRGEQLAERLARLPVKYPRTVKAVRGRGLLHALELAPRDDGLFTSYLWHQGLWSYAVAATLAEQASLLLLPTLGEAAVLRVAPPLTVTDEQIDLLADGLESVLAQLERGAGELVARCTGATRGRIEGVTLPPPPPQPRAARRWAFLIHYTQPEDVVTTDPSLARLSAEEREAFIEFAAGMPPGVVVRAPCDGLVIALPLLPSEMMRRGRRRMEAEIVRAVELAARLGAGVVGLGGYTAPYSRKGLAVVGRGPTITTGNTLTAAMAVAAALRALPGLEDRTVAVVGARGSVGALCARLLAREQPRRLILVGNPASGTAQLETFAAELRAEVGGLDSLAAADLIVSAAAAGRPILGEARLKPGAVICDVARPADAPPSVRARRDLTVIDGGLVALPDPAMRFGAGNLQGLPDGIQLACLAETMLLALAGETRDRGVGDTIWLDEADELMRLAARHGFTLPQNREVRHESA